MNVGIQENVLGLEGVVDMYSHLDKQLMAIPVVEKNVNSLDILCQAN